MRRDELEELIERNLQALPSLRAPETLLPRVLTAVAAWSARPWYARAWFSWPIGLQIASAVALTVVVAAVAFGMAHAAAGHAALIAGAANQLRAIGIALQTGADAFEALWRGIVRPVAPYALAVVSVMCVVCGACAAALNQIVMRRAVHR